MLVLATIVAPSAATAHEAGHYCKVPSGPECPVGEDAFVQSGEASWYGPGFHGRPTASGVRFDQDALTAAHRSLPLGTVVRVTNLDTGRSVQVEINDRGPFIEGRIIDVSRRAAEVLGMKEQGIAPVQVELARDPAPDIEVAEQPAVEDRLAP
ncbi:MAG TPA: septal ring lytic transglycosylase RlpA family protein [Azospirillum sp.]|nr:septal ring lytic transglycosylase RlpA family protein [Azospirillum sp.]